MPIQTVRVVGPGALDTALASKADLVQGKVPLDQMPTLDGVNGKSAYELAVDGGYTGTQTQWLASLKGVGDSAYQSAVSLGFTGDVAAWLATLKGSASTVAGPAGPAGAAGVAGPTGPAGAQGVAGVLDRTQLPYDTRIQNSDGTYPAVGFAPVSQVLDFIGVTPPDPSVMRINDRYFAKP